VGERLGGEDTMSYRVRLYDPCCGLSREMTLDYLGRFVELPQYDGEGRMRVHTFEREEQLKGLGLWLYRYTHTREVLVPER
jgi:hypothetical protein